MQWTMHKEPWQKTKLQHTTTVWYSGLFTNKYDKFMDTSIQLLSNAKIRIRLHLLTFHIRLVQSTMPQTMNSKEYG